MILERLFNSGGTTRTISTASELAKYLGTLNQTASGANVTPERAFRLVAVAACVKVLAESVGQLPFHLLKRRGLEIEKAHKHPLYSLLHDSPNEWMTAQEWLEWMVGCLCLRGNAYNQIIWVGHRGNRRVAELLPIAPTSIVKKQDPVSREVRYEVAQPDGTKLLLPADEVLHIPLFTLDGLVGASPVTYARESIGLAIATEEHGAGLFKHGASPSGILHTEQALDEAAQTRIRNSWNDRNAGSHNAGRVAVLEGGLTWQQVTMSSLDAQWLESRNFQRSEIAGIYRVPPHMIGDLQRATFSNIEHQGLEFVVHTLMPYLRRIEQRVHMQLLNPDEKRELYLKANAGGLLRGDMAARATFYQQLVQMGALSPNEVRAFEDMNPREGGDIWLTPSNMLVDGKLPDAGTKTPESE